MTRTDELAEIARGIAAGRPLPPGWPHKSRAIPGKDMVTPLRRAGWPLVSVEIEIEHRHADGRAMRRPYTVVCVPLPWLAAFGRAAGITGERLFRGKVDDE